MQPRAPEDKGLPWGLVVPARRSRSLMQPRAPEDKGLPWGLVVPARRSRSLMQPRAPNGLSVPCAVQGLQCFGFRRCCHET